MRERGASKPFPLKYNLSLPLSLVYLISTDTSAISTDSLWHGPREENWKRKCTYRRDRDTDDESTLFLFPLVHRILQFKRSTVSFSPHNLCHTYLGSSGRRVSSERERPRKSNQVNHGLLCSSRHAEGTVAATDTVRKGVIKWISSRSAYSHTFL